MICIDCGKPACILYRRAVMTWYSFAFCIKCHKKRIRKGRGMLGGDYEKFDATGLYQKIGYTEDDE